MDTIRGIVGKILNANEETGSVFAVVRYESVDGLVEAKVSGRYRNLAEGDFVEISGEWQEKKRNGRTEEILSARSIKPSLPVRKDTLRAWFLTIFDEKTHGVTPASTDVFLRVSGPNLVARCEADPSVLADISVDPDKFGAAIEEAWSRRVSGRKAISMMETAGVERKAIDLAVSAFKDRAYEILSTDPYKAIRIPKFGFANADRIGAVIGISRTDVRRITAAFLQCLTEERGAGHTFIPIDGIVDKLAEDFGIGADAVHDFALANADNRDMPFLLDRRDGRIVMMDRELFHAEASVARNVARLLRDGRGVDRDVALKAVEDILSTRPIPFDDVQKAASVMAVSENFCILTGGPGTGKSAVSDVIIASIEAVSNSKILPCAPTGKAAKRLEETTRKKTETVHSLLGAGPAPDGIGTAFKRNASNPLPSGCTVLVDEASMLDATTMRALVEAMPSDGRLILVGDTGQLPSVDAGAVLADLMSASVDGGHVVPRTQLVHVYRQKADSMIAVGAAEVREGNLPEMTPLQKGGLCFREHESTDVLPAIRELVEKALMPKGYVAEHIVVLSPQAPGPGGTWEINTALSDLFNPDGARIPGAVKSPDDEKDRPIPRVGDRVMLTDNDKVNEVMNGDTGKIVSTFEKKTQAGSRSFFKVLYDSGKEVEYPATSWRNLLLAYSITIHKSQGSQYPVVIMPTIGEHVKMLDRAILYTGWTRAKTLLYLFGQREAVNAAVGNVEKSKRNTRLAEFIRMLAVDMGIPAAHPWQPPAVPSTATAAPSTAGTAPEPRRQSVRLFRPVSARPADPVVDATRREASTGPAAPVRQGLPSFRPSFRPQIRPPAEASAPEPTPAPPPPRPTAPAAGPVRRGGAFGFRPAIAPSAQDETEAPRGPGF